MSDNAALDRVYRPYLRLWILWAVLWALMDYFIGTQNASIERWLDSVFYLGLGLGAAHAVNKGWL